jgi:hypothetical protein
MSQAVKIAQPHAAVLVFNYRDRLGTEKTVDTNTVDEIIISTISLIGARTSKSKGTPAGKFEFTLAPTKNWVSTLTAGSWAVLMMSRTPITERDIKKASEAKVKMFGKIESVRVNVSVNPQTGARETTYQVVGVDWGHVFENMLYIDPFIAPGANTLAQATALDIFKNVKGAKGIVSVLEMMTGLLSIMGKPLSNQLVEGVAAQNRTANANFAFEVPRQLNDFFDFRKNNGTKEVNSEKLLELLEIVSGKLVAPDDKSSTTSPYKPTNEAIGIIAPSKLIGTNTFWQLLVEHSNPALNEMIPEIRWSRDGRPSLTIYHRIRPFVFKGRDRTAGEITAAISKDEISKNLQKQRSEVERVSNNVKELISEFQNVRTHTIDLTDIVSVEAGTNWRDKYNFVEIKPNLNGAGEVFGNHIKRAAQTADIDAFAREGLRPLLVPVKQYPRKLDTNDEVNEPNTTTAYADFDFNMLYGWKNLIREWHFDTHRLLNGTVTAVGQDMYIQVGDNIMIDARAIGITPNIKKATLKKQRSFLLAHVESISNSFSVDINGARSFFMTINFVRGIVVDENKKPIGLGKLDNKSTDLVPAENKNTVNTVSTSGLADPDPQKLRGN